MKWPIAGTVLAAIVAASVAAGQHAHEAPQFSDQVVHAVPGGKPINAHPQEDEPGYNCATMGNHVCGPNNPEGLAAGCYDKGTLVTPWTRFDDPTADPLYGQMESPCKGKAPTQEAESDAAYAAAQQAQH